MSELSDETRRALENETNRGPWDDFSPYYFNDEDADDALDWDDEDDQEDNDTDYLEADFGDEEVVSWDEYLALLPWLDRQWARFTTWWPIVRLSNWWYRLSTRLHRTGRHSRF